MLHFKLSHITKWFSYILTGFVSASYFIWYKKVQISFCYSYKFSKYIEHLQSVYSIVSNKIWCLLFEWQMKSLFKWLALIFSLIFCYSSFRQNNMLFIPSYWSKLGALRIKSWKQGLLGISLPFYNPASFLQLSPFLGIGFQLSLKVFN